MAHQIFFIPQKLDDKNGTLNSLPQITIQYSKIKYLKKDYFEILNN
jgi:hypothetical protein